MKYNLLTIISVSLLSVCLNASENDRSTILKYMELKNDINTKILLDKRDLLEQNRNNIEQIRNLKQYTLYNR